ncbi:MAG: universal stress protein [Cytophagales bacterium]|nr:MAG: universal stress protein [Cytophagales bacterium]TAF61911.1 MAG: universal stress protein [Cytophagales bacterium]
MENILIPTDFSGCAINALDYAVYLASLTKAKIYVHHSISSQKSYGNEEFALYSELLLEKDADVRKKVETFIEPHQNALYVGSQEPVQWQSAIGYSSLVEDIKKTVEQELISLIVMGTNGADGLKEVFIGSATADVAERMNCPLLAIPESAKFNGLKKIVYATDFHRYDPKVLQTLKRWALVLDANINCLHVSTDVDRYMDDLKKMHELEQIAGSSIKFHIVQAESLKDGIEKYNRKNPSDLLVMLNYHRSIVERLLHRSNSKKMVYSTKIPLLILKAKRV